MRGLYRRSLAMGVASVMAQCAPVQAATVTHPATTVLYNFQGFSGDDGNDPQASLIFGPGGALFGTTYSGGGANGGTVFELTPPTGGSTSWTETVIHSFGGSGDGYNPISALIADGAGNLYGTAQLGGASGATGVVFELSPPVGGVGPWTETVLHSFMGPDGILPVSGLAMDAAGNLYGTTQYGGAAWNGGFSGQGVVFELSPPANGQSNWTETVLHSFGGGDGYGPVGGVTLDSAGNLYGAAPGGSTGYGLIYELTPPAGGATAWTQSILHNFDFSDGYYPNSSLVADAGGNLYGTAAGGGAAQYGVVFQLAPPKHKNDPWRLRDLHSYRNAYGANPQGNVVLDGTGNVYVTTPNGGAGNDGGVFELVAPPGGIKAWQETVFLGTPGTKPVGGVIVDGAGNIYGTASLGGSAGDGVVFEVTP